jgi:ElaB/YqjD/DUF883 family membrane-anchored ribosome-binding protein
MSDQTQDDLKTLRAELAQLRADFGKIAETMQNIVKDGSADAIGRARQAAEKLREDVSQKTERLAQEIEQRPLTAALTAFGIGLVLGLLFGGRHSRSRGAD